MPSETTLKVIFFALLAIAVVLEVIGDVFFKRWSLEVKNSLFVLGLLTYSAGAVFWAFSLKYEYMSKAISIFAVLNLIVVVLVGVIYFKEELSLINKLGIGLGLLSVILIEM